MDKTVTLKEAMQYCGLAVDVADDQEVSDQDMKDFLCSLQAAAADFKGFGDLPEGDEDAGVNASEWNAIRDAVKAEVKICQKETKNENRIL